MTELASEMVMPKQQTTPIIDKLVSQGLVQRDYDSIDRRIIKISLTSLGLDLLETYKKNALDVLHAKLQCLDSQDLNCLDVSLTNLYRILNKITLALLTTIVATLIDCYI
jgi:DNA-binding MarR family transcriptional regulator